MKRQMTRARPTNEPTHAAMTVEIAIEFPPFSASEDEGDGEDDGKTVGVLVTWMSSGVFVGVNPFARGGAETGSKLAELAELMMRLGATPLCELAVAAPPRPSTEGRGSCRLTCRGRACILRIAYAIDRRNERRL